MSEASFTFYRETRFKEVNIFEKILHIPYDWEFVSIEEIVSNEKGSIRMGPFGSQLKKSELVENGPIKVYGQENVMKNDFTLGNRFITVEKFKKLQGFEILPGDVLLTMMGSVGFATVFPKDAQRGIMDSHLLRIRVNLEKILPEYMALLFTGYSLIKMQIQRLSQGAIMSGLNTSLVKAIKIPLPPLEEQKKIAEVLRSIDEAIQAVDESITRLERLKKGAMETLLTRGINHTRFKTVELNGRKIEIPEEWEVVELGEVAERRNESVNPANMGNVPFVGLEHIEPGNIRLSQWGNSSEVKSSKSKFYPGDILYGKLRPYLDKAVIADFEGICSTDIIVIKAKEDKTIPEYLIWVIHSKGFIEYAKKTMKGVNHPRTSWKSIKQFQIPLPPLEEQKKIAEILRTIDEAIEAKRAKKEKLERMKKAVMEKLLTGEVRIRQNIF